MRLMRPGCRSTVKKATIQLPLPFATTQVRAPAMRRSRRCMDHQATSASAYRPRLGSASTVHKYICVTVAADAFPLLVSSLQFACWAPAAATRSTVFTFGSHHYLPEEGHCEALVVASGQTGGPSRRMYICSSDAGGLAAGGAAVGCQINHGLDDDCSPSGS